MRSLSGADKLTAQTVLFLHKNRLVAFLMKDIGGFHASHTSSYDDHSLRALCLIKLSLQLMAGKRISQTGHMSGAPAC